MRVSGGVVGGSGGEEEQREIKVELGLWGKRGKHTEKTCTRLSDDKDSGRDCEANLNLELPFSCEVHEASRVQ